MTKRIPLLRFILVLGIITGCVSSPRLSIEFLVSPDANVSAEQMRALRHAIADTPGSPDWVEVKRVSSQEFEPGHGRANTYLWAEALWKPAKIDLRLCRGRLMLFIMRGEDLDRNRWLKVGPETYASFSSSSGDSCLLPQNRDQRFWLRGGVSDDEVAGVLAEVTATPSNGGENPILEAGERIDEVKKTVVAGGVVIRIHTSQGEGHGRVLEFRKVGAQWVGRVTGTWMA